MKSTSFLGKWENMTGLRARQKADKIDRMLQSAARLFREQGYGAAHIEDIAAAADVSVGTFYNYFGTKGDVLLATVSMEVEEVLAHGDALLADPPRDVALALQALVGGYYDHSLVYLTKEMWRTAMALSIDAPAGPLSRRYTELDGLLCDQVCGLIQRLQGMSLVRADCDARAMGEVAFNNLNMMFTDFVRDDDMTLQRLMAAVGRQNRALANLMAP